MSAKIHDLIHHFKLACMAEGADAADITTAMMLLLYELAITRAALTQTTPSEELAKLISILEESFGEYLKDHAASITRLNTLGDALMGRKA